MGKGSGGIRGGEWLLESSLALDSAASTSAVRSQCRLYRARQPLLRACGQQRLANMLSSASKVELLLWRSNSVSTTHTRAQFGSRRVPRTLRGSSNLTTTKTARLDACRQSWSTFSTGSTLRRSFASNAPPKCTLFLSPPFHHAST